MFIDYMYRPLACIKKPLNVQQTDWNPQILTIQSSETRQCKSYFFLNFLLQHVTYFCNFRILPIAKQKQGELCGLHNTLTELIDIFKLKFRILLFLELSTGFCFLTWRVLRTIMVTHINQIQQINYLFTLHYYY